MNIDKKSVAIIIINYNGLDDTLECIKSIKKSQTKYGLKIIVVDNCSRVNEAYRIKANFEDVVVIRSNVNGGFSYGNNIGIKWAIINDYNYILLLNNDTIIKFDMIDILIDACDTQIVVPTMFYYGEDDLAWYAGGFINKKTGNAKHKHMNERIDINSMSNEICTFATGCCFAAKSETIKKIGYLDDSYFMYCEDTDYCIRANLMGIKIEYIPKAVLWHKVSQSTGGGDSPFSIYYMTRNRLNYIKKYISYFGVSAYWFSFISRIIRMLLCKDNKIKKAFIEAINDHKQGKTGKIY
ncbi:MULTISPECIES: glycosyltransferase family 2 protein [Bacillota]|uniref:glycosyltransferase family 2 protein n=1 Tax=Bacillota TaxID=1239 RepID=UPI0025A077D1|nr:MULTISPECIES: glycosyltransferase family 2 protein [Bacillota]